VPGFEGFCSFHYTICDYSCPCICTLSVIAIAGKCFIFICIQHPHGYAREEPAQERFAARHTAIQVLKREKDYPGKIRRFGMPGKSGEKDLLFGSMIAEEIDDVRISIVYCNT